jgi:transcriptional regulator GlxA family with amidase domain
MDRRVSTVIALMNQNLHRPVSSSELARAVHLSPSHLGELFKRETGTSLARYGRELRLQQAKKFLETTFLSVKEIVARCGLSGVSHFAREFKKAYGATPSQYAPRCRRADERKDKRGRRNPQIG